VEMKYRGDQTLRPREAQGDEEEKGGKDLDGG